MATVYGQIVDYTAVKTCMLTQIKGLQVADGRLLDWTARFNTPFEGGEGRDMPALKTNGRAAGMFFCKIGQ